MFKSAAERVRKVFEQPFNKAVDAMSGLFANEDQIRDDDKQVLALIKAVLPTDQVGLEKALSRVHAGLERQNVSERKSAYILEFLRKVAPGTPEKALPVLQKYDPLDQKMMLNHLLSLSLDHGEFRAGTLEISRKIAAGLNIGEAELESMIQTVKTAYQKRSTIIRSGTGIILALVVIVLFVLIATWLSSLLFGMALAFIFLPLEQYFERMLRKSDGKVSGFFAKIFVVKKISDRFRRQESFDLSDAELRRREQQAITTKATTLTVSCVVAGSVLLLVGILIGLNFYFGQIKNNISALSTPAVDKTEQVQKETPAAAPALADKSVPAVPEKKAAGLSRQRDELLQGISSKLTGFLNDLKHRFQELPLVQGILNELSNYLSEGKAEKQLTELLLKKSGGIFAFLARFVGLFATFILNVLMTFFFFSLLLSKLAGFINSSSDGQHKQRATSYLIRTVFNGKWLPMMSEENLREGDRIVSEVVNKLRIWLRGYMLMIFIDFCVYSTIFTLLDVPYALILGAIAGVGILLPYIGPVASALLSVLVTLAVGGPDVSVMQIAGIIGAYLLHNGIIEQFFIYPMIIGESLGLTTLETIIVVLLGGIMAGIPGMIFALPTASVIKYLVPQIYRCWR
ncbi:MAG: AI-2E family transporter [Lentisphaerae bacterium]|nr:AI-2E family transporter [Lentisphaerota bacterium]